MQLINGCLSAKGTKKKDLYQIIHFMTKSNTQKAASLLLKVFVNKTLYQNESKKQYRIYKKKKPAKSPAASEKLITKYIMDLTAWNI